MVCCFERAGLARARELSGILDQRRDDPTNDKKRHRDEGGIEEGTGGDQYAERTP
jgi:hypothetical protein